MLTANFKDYPYSDINSYQFMSEILDDTGGIPSNWRAISQDIIDIVRANGDNRFIVWSHGQCAFSQNYKYTVPFDDDRIIYNLHHYDPHTYTHQLTKEYPELVYTSEMKAQVEERIQDMIEFRNVNPTTPILLGTYGVSVWVSDANQWYIDVHAMLEANDVPSIAIGGVGHTYQGWDTRYTAIYDGNGMPDYTYDLLNDQWLELKRHWNS